MKWPFIVDIYPLGSHVRRPRVSKNKRHAQVSPHQNSCMESGEFGNDRLLSRECLLQFAKNEQNGFLEGFLILSIHIWEKGGAAKYYV